MPEKLPEETGRKVPMFSYSLWGFTPYWPPPLTPEEAKIEMLIYCIFLAIAVPLGAIIWAVGKFLFHAW